MRALASEFPFDVAPRGYAVGSAVLEAILPPSAMEVLLEQLAGALDVIAQHDPARIAPLGGECAVSVAPFSALAHRYGDDLAILWIDSHPDIGTPASEYPGFHAMAVSALTGHGDGDSPGVLRSSTRALLDWLAATGCTKVAIHFDVDTVDSNEVVLGLGAVPDGLTSAQVRPIVADVTAEADVVGITIAEFFPGRSCTCSGSCRTFHSSPDADLRLMQPRRGNPPRRFPACAESW